jgi:hypothetical protein
MNNETCGVKQKTYQSWMDRGRVCSLEPGHDGPHRGYWNHEITTGANLCWLGPWEDDSEWQTGDYEQLYAEWLARDVTDLGYQL